MTGAPNESAKGHEDEQPIAEMLAAILKDNRYTTIATADAGGRPWASPVWCASVDRDLSQTSRKATGKVIVHLVAWS
jgi:hypothetical protein